jgi:hypothetical protein
MAKAKRTEPLTDAERQAKRKAAIKKAGGRRISLILDAETARIVDAMMERYVCTQTEAIAGCIARHPIARKVLA